MRFADEMVGEKRGDKKRGEEWGGNGRACHTQNWYSKMRKVQDSQRGYQQYGSI